MNPTKLNPVQAEATGEPITFEFEDESYTIPAANEWDLDVLEAFEAGQIVKTTKTLLGDEQYAKFKAPGRTVGDLGRFFEALQGAAGVPS